MPAPEQGVDRVVTLRSPALQVDVAPDRGADTPGIRLLGDADNFLWECPWSVCVGPRASTDSISGFLESYAGGWQAILPNGGTPFVERGEACAHRLGWHLAALMLARVAGVSPADYLTYRHSGAIRAAAIEVLSVEDASATAAWDVVRRTAEGCR